jgi:hypothetical protein
MTESNRYAEAFLALFSAFFSAGVFNGFFFAFFLLSIPLLMVACLSKACGLGCSPIYCLIRATCNSRRRGFAQRHVSMRVIVFSPHLAGNFSRHDAVSLYNRAELLCD